MTTILKSVLNSKGMKILSRIYTLFFLLVGVFMLFFFSVKSADAATLASASGTLTTSRPSASAPLGADQAASAGQVTITDNGSIYLASDSAILRPDTGETLNTVTVASLSAANTPAANQRVVYFGGTAANTHHKGDAITTAISAMHKFRFIATNPIPNAGKIILTYPGAADNTASPSATTFAFNGLTTGNIVANNATCTFAVSSPSITCTLSAPVGAGTVVTILVGCSAQTDGECTTQVPTLINPTKTATAGTADVWKVTIDTQDNSSVALDTVKVAMGTIESVQVFANVDPTLTFTIAGIANATAINNGNTTGCLQTETTNAGLASTATVVNLGTLANVPTSTDTKVGNIAAQLLTVSTNAINGYSLVATSSGPLRNLATGFDIGSSTTPAVFPNGQNWFGLHACGLDTNPASTFWNSIGGGGNCNTYITGSTNPICKYGWPTKTSPVTIAYRTTGPVGNTITTGSGLVSVAYAAGVDARVPAGTYQAVVTYVATPSF